jgi:hypothetical protein
MVRLICWCMFAVVGDRLCVKKIRSLKKVNSMVRRYDILNALMSAQNINVMFMRCDKCVF